MHGLTFQTLRLANAKRLPEFKNSNGELSHPDPNGVDTWSITDWFTALAGEVGELANIIKKHRRGDITDEQLIALASPELAVVQTYLDLLAMRMRVDLGEVTMAKFNAVSERVGSKVKINQVGSDYYLEESAPKV